MISTFGLFLISKEKVQHFTNERVIEVRTTLLPENAESGLLCLAPKRNLGRAWLGSSPLTHVISAGVVETGAFTSRITCTSSSWSLGVPWLLHTLHSPGVVHMAWLLQHDSLRVNGLCKCHLTSLGTSVPLSQLKFHEVIYIAIKHIHLIKKQFVI